MRTTGSPVRGPRRPKMRHRHERGRATGSRSRVEREMWRIARVWKDCCAVLARGGALEMLTLQRPARAHTYAGTDTPSTHLRLEDQAAHGRELRSENRIRLNWSAARERGSEGAAGGKNAVVRGCQGEPTCDGEPVGGSCAFPQELHQRTSRPTPGDAGGRVESC